MNIPAYTRIRVNNKLSIFDIFNDIFENSSTIGIRLYVDNFEQLDLNRLLEFSRIMDSFKVSYYSEKIEALTIKNEEFFKIDWKNTNIMKSLTFVQKFNL